MANPDLTRADERKAILNEINGEENIARKRAAQRSFDCYRDRQAGYIQQQLLQEFDFDSVQDMRQITSINLTKRIVDELSSVYSREPERTFSNATDRVQLQIDNLYHYGNVNAKNTIANRYYNLFSQGCLYILPKGGSIQIKPIPLQSFDVIPDAEDSEKAYAYILNTWDMDYRNASAERTITEQQQRYGFNDKVNQKIADPSDRQKEQDRYIVWTPEVTYTMDGKGNILDDIEDNPIGRLPFIDFAYEKDSEFFVKRGSAITQFAIDMGVILSDTASISRNQGYAQGVISSVKQPKFVRGNINKFLWLPIDKETPDAKPTLEFVSPNPDLKSSLELIEVLINMFLTSRGLETGTISGKTSSQTASSGIERLLQMIEKFEASQDDFDVFRWVEAEQFDLMRAWSNFSQNISEGSMRLKDDLRLATIPENVDMSIKFKGPEAVKSDSDRLDEIERKIELGLLSRKRAIMEYYEVDEDKAQELMLEIDEREADSNDAETE